MVLFPRIRRLLWISYIPPSLLARMGLVYRENLAKLRGKKMKRKGMSRLLLFLLIVLFLALPTGPLSAQLVEKVKIGNIRDDVLRALPILAALDKGFWKGQGVDVEYVPFRGATEIHQGVAAGAVDTGVAGAASVMLVQARGVPEIIVADLQAPEDFFVWVRP